MAVNKVDLYVSQILEDLDNGLTWMKRDDVGYGSIQDKYNAKDQQIVMIRKHPALKDAETNITVFNIIDDTKNGSSTTSASLSTIEQRNADSVGRISKPEQVSARQPEPVLPKVKKGFFDILKLYIIRHYMIVLITYFLIIKIINVNFMLS